MANRNYVNRLSGPIEVKNASDDNLKIKLIDPDGHGNSGTQEEVSIEKSGTSLKVNNPTPMIVNTTGTNEDIIHFGEDVAARIDHEGVIFTTGIQQTCSNKFKENIMDIDKDSLEQFIEAVDIKSFDYIDKKAKGISLIIEEAVESNIPYQDHLFNKDESGDYSSLDVNSLLGMTLAVLKEERKKRMDLEERLLKLERNESND